jgi:hypothetical protein
MLDTLQMHPPGLIAFFVQESHNRFHCRDLWQSNQPLTDIVQLRLTFAGFSGIALASLSLLLSGAGSLLLDLSLLAPLNFSYSFAASEEGCVSFLARHAGED